MVCVSGSASTSTFKFHQLGLFSNRFGLSLFTHLSVFTSRIWRHKKGHTKATTSHSSHGLITVNLIDMSRSYAYKMAIEWLLGTDNSQALRWGLNIHFRD